MSVVRGLVGKRCGRQLRQRDEETNAATVELFGRKICTAKQRGMFLDHLRMVYFSTNAARVVELEVVSSYTVVALEQSRPLSQAGTSKAEAAGSVPLKVIKSSRWVAWDALQGAVEVAQNELRKPPMVEAKSKRLQVTPLMTCAGVSCRTGYTSHHPSQRQTFNHAHSHSHLCALRFRRSHRSHVYSTFQKWLARYRQIRHLKWKSKRNKRERSSWRAPSWRMVSFSTPPKRKCDTFKARRVWSRSS